MVERIHHRTCNLCEAMCGMVVTTDADEKITGIRGDKDDPFSRGHICPKGPAMRELLTDPDRARRPMRRTKGGWKPISWNEALDETADRFAEIQLDHGRSSVATYMGNPLSHNHGAMLGGQVFGAALHTRNKYDANSQDANPKLFAALQMFGSITSLTIPDIDHTDYFLVLGANPLASNGSLMSLGDVRGRLKGVRERGGKIVVVDPRRTETADAADLHLAIRPGGDAALMLAMLQVLFSENLVDRAAVARTAKGLAELERLAAPFTPEAVAGAVGIDATAIRHLAREFGTAQRAIAYGRVGVCLNEFAAVASWVVEALNVVTGNFDRPGGMMFTKPAIDLAALATRLGVGGALRYRSRVRGLPEVGGMLPGAAMAEEMETPGKGQIRGFFTLAGNPVLSVPNGERISRALEKLDFMASVDIYVNETTRHAHILLPPRAALERSHFDLLFNALAVRNVVKYSEPVVTPEPDTKDDYTILCELGARLAARKKGGKLAARLAAGITSHLLPSTDRLLDILLRTGPYGAGFRPGAAGLTLERVRAEPHGIDLGPLVPMGKQRVVTKDGLVDLAPEVIARDLPRVSEWLAKEPPTGLVLIGRRHVRSNNSWMHNIVSLTKGPDRATLLMHPDDAAARDLRAGERVRITTRVGSIETKLALSDAMRAGVVSLPHGFGHAAARDHLRVAGALDGPSLNAITDDTYLEPLTATAVLNGVEVTVERVAQKTRDEAPTNVPLAHPQR